MGKPLSTDLRSSPSYAPGAGANAKCLVHIGSRIGGCGKICHKLISRNMLKLLDKTSISGSLVNKTG